ncbi:hypothetical protein C0991_003449 [Blastosporella zonata]|nr:hypothetical protein C0991_003449 [Blastosporella zonata]
MAKRPRIEHAARVFTSVEDINSALRTQNQETLVQDLTALRNQLSIRPGEDAISPQDARLLLAQHWLEHVPGAHDLFGIWDSLTQRQNSLFALLVSVLSSLLTLTSSHYTFQALGQPIVKTLLTPTYTRRLNSYLGGTHAELILVTLKLYNALSSFAGGCERKAVMEAFGWELKSLPKLLNMRRKSGTDGPDALIKPDIRTLYVLFILSFISPDSPTQVKATFVEQHREPLLSIFKGLIQDSYPVVRKVLEVCFAGLWSDPKIKRTSKISLFNESTISHVLKLYDRSAAEDDDLDHVPADLVHHFLLAICTRPGTGICFKDRGWYPRESDGDDESGRGRIYNRILANILKTLKVNEDLRQQELALKIMSSCPELVSGYWSSAALTLEPRLSSKWIANISFFGSVLSQSVPIPSFYLPDSTLYHPTPPPLSTIIENILPSVNTKAHFSRGLHSSAGLVQHCTALALAKCLTKYEEVVDAFREVEVALEESDADGQWSKRRRDLEREVRKRVPDFQVIVAFSQQKFSEAPPAMTPGAPVPVPPANNPTRAALLAESAQRLLWMYQRCLPLVVAEARFDLGKLLQGFVAEEKVPEEEGMGEVAAADKLHVVRQLHVLRLLKDSDQFVWSGKMGSSSQSYLAVLLSAYTTTDIPATRMALSHLLEHILAESILFQDDPSEPYLWLLSLPMSRRGRGTESPDGASLTDEGENVIAFLDDCVQRCLKTPYRYIEDLHAFDNQSTPNTNQAVAAPERTEALPSPLLMTVLEQLEIKVSKKMLSASDVLALATFVRKLMFRLASTQQDLSFLRQVKERLDSMLHGKKLFSEFPVVTTAVRREVGLLADVLSLTRETSSAVQNVSDEVRGFLSEAEKMPIPPTKEARRSAAQELVDWLRLLDAPTGSAEVARVAGVLCQLHPPSLKMLLEHLSPASESIWTGLEVSSRYLELRQHLPFDFLFLHSGEQQLADPTCRAILAETAFGLGEPSLVEAKRAVYLIGHRLACDVVSEAKGGMFFLLALILKKASTTLPTDDFGALKAVVFIHSRIVKSYLRSGSLPHVIAEALHRLVQDSLDPGNVQDRELLSDTCSHWLEILMSDLVDDPIQVSLASTWIQYFQPEQMFRLLDSIFLDAPSIESISSTSTALALLGAVLTAVRDSMTVGTDSGQELIRRLPKLVALYSQMPSAILEELIAITLQSSLPAYHDGRRCGDNFEETYIQDITKQAELQWSRRLDRWPADLPVQVFLTQDSWTPSIVIIISGLIYRGHLPRGAIMSWLSSKDCTTQSLAHFIVVMHAFLDVTSSQGDELMDDDAWVTHFSRILDAVLDQALPQSIRSVASVCISLLTRLVPSRTSDFIATLVRTVQAFSVTEINSPMLSIGRQLHAHLPQHSEGLTTVLINHGIQWGTRFFAEEEDSDFDTVIDDLTLLARSASEVKPHLVETALGVVIQNRFGHLSSINLITILLSRVHLKPVVINRHLQSILQHASFFKYAGNMSTDASSTREVIVQLLHTLFNLHPSNTCQASHVEPLVRIYRGTLSKADGLILSIFRLFEVERKMSIASLLCKWSATPNMLSSTSLEAIHSLDAILLLRTCLSFPTWRNLEVLSTEKASSHEVQLYDPIFLILLFAQMLAENPPESAFAWVEVFRTNIASLLIKALSSKNRAMRDIALCQLAGLWQYLENADVQERPHVLHILTLLKDVLPPPGDEPPRRLPSYTTLLLLHALRGIFYPSNFSYPITARFLLQRPELDTNDVPMLYNMLYSSSDDWKKERGWMIRFLSDGMMSSADWRVLKGRHTWDLLASLFQSSEDDRALRVGILEVLANLTCNAQATMSLVLKSGLLSWIEIQLRTYKDTNTVEWIKILHNIMIIVDPGKLEASTNGEWRTVICRCLLILTENPKSAHPSAALLQAVQATLQLSLLPGPYVANMRLLLHQLAECLKVLEVSTTVPCASTRILPKTPSRPLYRAHEIHETSPTDELLQIWGASVEALWRISMTLQETSESWTTITSRMLVWRAIIGVTDGLGEWTRMEVVSNMSV